MLTTDRITELDSSRGAGEQTRPQSPLRHLDADAVSQAAKKETRNRELYLPPVTAYRWWARRTEAINGAILDALAKDLDPPRRLLVVDPFAGGGIIPLAAVIRGHRAYGQDLNPWAAAGLAGMLALGRTKGLAEAGRNLEDLARPLLQRAYATTFSDGSVGAISHTFRVATAACPSCRKRTRLFPHALVSLRVRRERRRDEAFLACPAGHLFEGTDTGIQRCDTCDLLTDPTAEYTPMRRLRCAKCSAVTRLEDLAANGAWSWEIVLVERVKPGARELGRPTPTEVVQAEPGHWSPGATLGEIPAGQETAVLLRHGFRRWEDIYPARQRVVLETLLALVPQASDEAIVRQPLRLAVVGAAEMAGHLSRWDRFYLKSYESMAGHRFNFTTFAAEPNVWGTMESGRGSVRRRLVSFAKAGRWLQGHRAADLSVEGPLVSSAEQVALADETDVRVVEGSSERLLLSDGCADIVLTDPPYHDDVQYGELSLPLRAWADQSMERLEGEALVNSVTGQNSGEDDYQALLARIFAEARRVLRPGGHLIFSYANRDPTAWSALLSSLQRAGFQGVGYCVLHSENETDLAKRDVRACTLDLLLDLVPGDGTVDARWSPRDVLTTSEGAFLQTVGRAVLRVGALKEEDVRNLETELAESDFLRGNGAANRPRSPTATDLPPRTDDE